MGVEPTTSTLARLRSTPELRPQLVEVFGLEPKSTVCRTVALPLSYTPI